MIRFLELYVKQIGLFADIFKNWLVLIVIAKSKRKDTKSKIRLQDTQ